MKLSQVLLNSLDNFITVCNRDTSGSSLPVWLDTNRAIYVMYPSGKKLLESIWEVKAKLGRWLDKHSVLVVSVVASHDTLQCLSKPKDCLVRVHPFFCPTLVKLPTLQPPLFTSLKCLPVFAAANSCQSQSVVRKAVGAVETAATAASKHDSSQEVDASIADAHLCLVLLGETSISCLLIASRLQRSFKIEWKCFLLEVGKVDERYFGVKFSAKSSAVQWLHAMW